MRVFYQPIIRSNLATPEILGGFGRCSLLSGGNLQVIRCWIGVHTRKKQGKKRQYHFKGSELETKKVIKAALDADLENCIFKIKPAR